MDNFTNVINTYLNNVGIKIDKDEFNYQFSCHPSYPSLLAVSDTLRFFGIKNGAFRIENSQLDALPNQFIAQIKEDKKEFLALVQCKEGTYNLSKDGKEINKYDINGFIRIFNGVVFLVEKEDIISNVKQKKDYLNPIFIFFLIVFCLWYLNNDFKSTIFLLFSMFGFFLSLAALKDLFNNNNPLIRSFCNISSVTSCDDVVYSDKWKIFKKISFSDLSITFFVTQIISFLLVAFNDPESYFFFQRILLLVSFPIICISIYYQKFIVNKWCPICILISSMILLQMGFVFLFTPAIFKLNYSFIAFYLSLFIISLVTWNYLKVFLNKVKNLKENHIEDTRLRRNYRIFKNTLTSKDSYQLPESLLTLGKQNAPLNIGIITSLSCRFCKEPHYILKSLIEKYRDKLNLTIIFNIPTGNEKHNEHHEYKRLAYYKLLLENQKSEESYFNAIDAWYSYGQNNKDKWMGELFNSSVPENVLELLDNQNLWCKKNGFNFTPCLFINGYKFPKEYKLVDLHYYIEDLLEESLQK